MTFAKHIDNASTLRLKGHSMRTCVPTRPASHARYLRDALDLHD